MILETHSGRDFDYEDPTADMIGTDDIARSLSQQARFLGHIRWPFSVAEHAMLVRALVREAGGDAELQLAALHHDSHEAYIGDLPSPLKAAIRAESKVYDNFRLAIDDAIADHLGIDVGLFGHPAVKQADADALYLEARELKSSRATTPHWDKVRAAWSGAPLPEGFATSGDPVKTELEFLGATWGLLEQIEREHA